MFGFSLSTRTCWSTHALRRVEKCRHGAFHFTNQVIRCLSERVVHVLPGGNDEPMGLAVIVQQILKGLRGSLAWRIRIQR